MTANSISRSASAAGRNPAVLLAAGYLSLLAVTWRLWIPQSEFPQVPLISAAARLPPFVEYGVLALLILSLGSMLVVKRLAICCFACLLTGLCTLGLICIDQHRLQPWAWQFVILSFVLATSDRMSAVGAWRWLVIGICCWSAWSKMDRGFCEEHGPFLLDGFCKSVGLARGTEMWSPSMRWNVAAAIPVGELTIGLGLIWKQTRFTALCLSIAMHTVLIMALGPLGHGHRAGVLVWNAWFIVQNWFLFGKTDEARIHADKMTQPGTRQSSKKKLAYSIVAITMLWPLLEPAGFCDHWPAWAVYAAKPERVTVFVREDELNKLPDELKRYIEPQASPAGWHPFRADRWSLDSLAVPIYPQDRFQVGVALGLVHRCQLTTIRVVVQGPANRLTGHREVREYNDLTSIMQLAETFRCGAVPGIDRPYH